MTQRKSIERNPSGLSDFKLGLALLLVLFSVSRCGYNRLQYEEGFHYRFDYSFEFYPSAWVVSALALIEHVQAGRLILRKNGLLQYNIPASYNDVGTKWHVERSLGKFILALDTELLLREDTDDATYPTLDDTGKVTSRRTDFQISVQPMVTFPLSATSQLFGSYEWVKRFSSLGPGDYVDRNLEDNLFWVGLRVSLTDL